MNSIKNYSLLTSEQKLKLSQDAFSWCIKNKIYIYAKAISNTKLNVAIKYKHKPEIVGDIIYESKPKGKTLDWSKKIYELHLEYYNKREIRNS